MENKEQKNSSYMFRLIIGVYLIYLAVSLGLEAVKGNTPFGAVFVICVLLFGAAGTAITVLSARCLFRLGKGKNRENTEI